MMWQALRDGAQRLTTQAFGSQLRCNMVSGVVLIAVNMIALAFSYPLYLRFLGYEKYGVWLVLTTVLGFAQLGMLGIRKSITKLVAEEYARGALQSAQSYVTMALTILTITGTTALLAILLLKGQITAAFRLGDENAQLVFWLLPYVGLLTIYVFLIHALTATLSGLGRMDIANYTQATGRIAAVSISVLLLCFGRGVESLLIGNTLSYVVINIISLVFIRRHTKMRLLRLGNWNWQRLKKLLSFGGGIFGGSLMNMLLDPFNKLMLSRYAGVASVPVYDIAFRGSMQIRAVFEAGFRAIMPEISRLGANMTAQAHERIVAINRRAVNLILVGGIPLFGGLFIFAGVLLKLWLGEKFVDMLPQAFRIILVGTFLSLIGVPAFYTLLGLGKSRYFFFSSVIKGVVNATIIATIVLVRGKISVHSVAWAVMIALGITSCYILWQNYRAMQNKQLEIRSNFVNPLEDIAGPCRG